MEKNQNIIVGISIGDLNGIGPEVVLKTFEDHRILELCTPVIFASAKTLSHLKKELQLSLNFYGIDHTDKILPGKINVFNVWKEHVEINPGKEDKKIGKYAYLSLKTAVKALKNNNIDVLVTAPINKHTIHSEEFPFQGHTEYLAQELGGESLMFMVSEHLKVGLLTGHVPVKDVNKHITEALIEKKISLMMQSLRRDFGITKPKIAVLGINPHSGDKGVIGTEDDVILRPTIQKLNDAGLLVYGPYAADSFFGSRNYLHFDAVLAAYHDQGLVPFKTLSFGNGVNFTAGLNFVRTSPDHGTGFEIAGKNKADYSSFSEAIYTAITIYRTRQEYDLLLQNQLTSQKNRPIKTSEN